MIIADTGFWLALANKRDHYHGAAVDRLSRIEEKLITTWPVVTETCHVLMNRLGLQAQLAFIDSWRNGAFEVFEISMSHASHIRQLMMKYSDLPMDLADASLVLVAEELKSGRILSTDQRNFGVYRWKNQRPFENLLP
jgi:uncharacterized protein